MIRRTQLHFASLAIAALVVGCSRAVPDAAPTTDVPSVAEPVGRSTSNPAPSGTPIVTDMARQRRIDDMAARYLDSRLRAIDAAVDEARGTVGRSSTTTRVGLEAYARAERYVRMTLLEAKGATTSDNESRLTDKYRALLRESDAYTARVVTPAFIESTPWTDLLGSPMASRWSRSSDVPGFSINVLNGTLTVSPPDAGSARGVTGVRSDDLLSFLVDMEFQIDGTATMYFHAPTSPYVPDAQSEAFELTTAASGLAPGMSHRLAASYVGSTLRVTFPDEPGIRPYESSQWLKRRAGGVVFVIPSGTHLKITKLRIKDLR